jgi:ERCC4-related helicase/ERCC4-type nuclease
VYVAHPRLQPETVEDRDYQRELAARIVQGPTLLVLPTGLGKTVVALRAMLHYLERDPERRILLLAPTKPLCDQHAAYLRRVLVDASVALMTGEASPAQRDQEWTRSRVVVATPQVVQNDLVRGARDLADVGFLIYDEAHRATGNYPYGFIARRYRAAGGRWALGLTASPGNDAVTVRTVLRNLNLERVEVRTDRDRDVAPYVHDVETEWVRVRPTLNGVRLMKLIERMLGRAIVQLRRLGYLQSLRGLPGRKELLMLGARLREEASGRQGGRAVYDAVSLQARALKLQHAMELAETQGSPGTFAFLRRLEQEASTTGGTKASRDLVREPEFAEALALAGNDPEPSPKLVRVVQLVRDGLAAGQRRVLVFANYRETADALVAALAKEPQVRPSRFVGHATAAGERGLTQREQEAIVARFRAGDLNVLVATAVGEEGLDLPETDAVILHEPVPSAIRFVQRRGRTGRHSPGRLLVLLMEGTRDEAYHWSALRRERKMGENLAALKRVEPLSKAPGPEPTPASPPVRASDILVPGLEVTMDPREAGTALARALLDRGVRIRSQTLPTGDYSISDRILLERKSAADFVASIKDGRLADQLPRLAQAERALLLVEGDPFAAPGGVRPAAIAGAIAAALADHRVSVVTVPDAETGADLLVSLARREQRQGAVRPLRIEKVARTPDAQLRFVLEGLPHVGPVTARHLLERFGSIAALADATIESLEETPGVGPETARAIRELLNRRYASAAPAQVQVAVAALEGGNGAAR